MIRRIERMLFPISHLDAAEMESVVLDIQVKVDPRNGQPWVKTAIASRERPSADFEGFLDGKSSAFERVLKLTSQCLVPIGTR